MMESIRISKYFTDCGIMSRRAAEAEIQGGKVKVNGKIATLGQKIDPAVDVVEYNGKIIRMLTNEKFYIMLNKPRGIVTTASDEKGRTDVTHLCRDLKDSAGKSVRVYPIGRLDMDSDGLLLLTNDGELANKLTHPRHSIPKIYHVTIDGVLSDPQINVLGNSILIDGRETVPVTVQKLAQNASNTIVQFELYEGRNRQIRKMCESLDLEIISLKRIAIGDLKLGNLKPGTWKKLTKSLVDYLRQGR